MAYPEDLYTATASKAFPDYERGKLLAALGLTESPLANADLWHLYLTGQGFVGTLGDMLADYVAGTNVPLLYAALLIP